MAKFTAEKNMTMTDLGGAGSAPRSNGPVDGPSVKDMASAAVQTVKAETASFAAAAQDKMGEKVTQQTAAATQTLGDFASAIRRAGDDLAQHDQSVAGRVVKQAADGLEGLTRSLSDKKPEELLDAVRDFGRQNPAAFIAGSVLLGVTLGRLAKSSERRTEDAPQASGYRPLSSYAAAGRPAGAAVTGPRAVETHDSAPTGGGAFPSPYGSEV